MRTYRYVGPPEIKARSANHPPGREIRTPADALAWIHESTPAPGPGDIIPATFVITTDHRLLVADRHSEHVACAAGRDVLAAGEIFFAINPPIVIVEEITNQSTGYCPEPSCWRAVDQVLSRIALPHPAGFTTVCVFRRCPNCGARNIVKDDWFFCDVCRHELPAEWNFGDGAPPTLH